MKKDQPIQSVAAKFPILYFYVLVNILLTSFYTIIGLHLHKAPNASRPPINSEYYIAVALVATTYLAIEIYLLTAKRIKRVQLLLKIILALQLLGLLANLLRLSYDLIPNFLVAGLTFTVLRTVQGKKDTVVF